MALKAKATWQGTFSAIGDPMSGEGALYGVRGPAGLVQLFHQLYRNQLQLRQGSISPLEDAVLGVLAEEKKRDLDAEVCAQGVPPRLAKLLRTEQKDQQRRIVTSEPLRGGDFHALTFNCETVGYAHESETHEFIPEHLEFTTDDHDAVFVRRENSQRSFRRLVAGFKERKKVTFHLFRERDGTNWHCFYFTLRDMFGHPDTKVAHWKGGPHVHYVSRAYVDEDADEFVDEFRTGNWKFSSEHVAWRDS